MHINNGIAENIVSYKIKCYFVQRGLPHGKILAPALIQFLTNHYSFTQCHHIKIIYFLCFAYHRYKIVLDTDATEFGGHGHLDHTVEFYTFPEPWDNRNNSALVCEKNITVMTKVLNHLSV